MMDVEGKGTEMVATEKGKDLLEPKPGVRQAADGEIAPISSYMAYPEALARYQDVVDDKNLFMETLEKLHLAMRTKFMIPTIGGKELDLHRLFVEVTSRGGIQKVIGDRRWREVINIFNFPSTTTNASFVLRKYYMSLLSHYEHIYFFGAKEWSVPSTVSLSATPTTTFQPKRSTEFALPVPENQSAARKRSKVNGEVAITGPTLPSNRTVTGVIDGKFEDGYFVTVTLGTTKLKGVLFHASDQSAVQGPPVFSGIADSSGSRVIRRRRKRKKLSSRDPTHPKPNRSGYNFFFAAQHARLKLLYPGKDREISGMIGGLWNNLSETEKAVYQESGLKDKQRYQTEMAVYKERKRTCLNVMPLQQRLAESSIKMCDFDLRKVTDAETPSDHDIFTMGKKSEEEYDPQSSPEAGAGATESVTVSMAADHSAQGNAFELRWRDATGTGNDTETSNGCNLPSSNEDVESK